MVNFKFPCGIVDAAYLESSGLITSLGSDGVPAVTGGGAVIVQLPVSSLHCGESLQRAGFTTSLLVAIYLSLTFGGFLCI